MMHRYFKELISRFVLCILGVCESSPPNCKFDFQFSVAHFQIFRQRTCMLFHIYIDTHTKLSMFHIDAMVYV